MSSTVSYKGNTIGTASNSTLTLTTGGTWVEDDIVITDVTSGGGSPVIQSLSVTENGTYTAPSGVDGYSPVTVNVSGGGSVTAHDLFSGVFPSGDIVEDTIQTFGTSLYGNTAITSFESSSITAFKTANCFYGCTSLKNVKLTAAISQMQGNMFQNCSTLESIEMPALATSFNGYCGGDCPSLTFADLGNCTQIQANAFKNASSLDTLILRRPSVCALQNISAFSGTPFASGGSGGTIYAPSSLISSYQSASNWSTVHGYGTITWKAIEGSEYE